MRGSVYMGRIQKRDVHCYEQMLKSRLIFDIQQISAIWYNQSGNISSSQTICARRVKILEEKDYIFKVNHRKFGQAQYYSAIKQGSNAQITHKWTIAEFWKYLALNGFTVLDCESEKKFLNGELRCDMMFTVRYADNPPFYIILECDISKDFNSTGYEKLIKSIQEGTTVFDKKVLIVSICDHPIESSEVKRYVIQIKRNFSDFSRFVYQFIK